MCDRVASATDAPLQLAAEQLIAAGARLHQQGMVPATSGNFSIRLADGRIAMTVSGRHKGALTRADIMSLSAAGVPLDAQQPSAECGLHLQIYRHDPAAAAILHPHSPAATVISRQRQGELQLTGYELLKALPGISSHTATVTIPIFDNDQDIPRLAARVADWMANHDPTPAYLIAGHGFYTWGANIDAALRQVEALEFLFDCELRLQ